MGARGALCTWTPSPLWLLLPADLQLLQLRTPPWAVRLAQWIGFQSESTQNAFFFVYLFYIWIYLDWVEGHWRPVLTETGAVRWFWKLWQWLSQFGSENESSRNRNVDNLILYCKHPELSPDSALWNSEGGALEIVGPALIAKFQQARRNELDVGVVLEMSHRRHIFNEYKPRVKELYHTHQVENSSSL